MTKAKKEIKEKKESTPFDVQHDAPEPFGFLIKHDEIGT